jgi:trigger factor
MEFSVNKTNSANLTISGEITKSDIDTNLEKIAKDLSQRAEIPGFRKGKVPVKAVKQYYGKRLVDDAKAEVLRQLLEKGQAEAKIDPNQIITDPDFTKFEDKEDGSLSVELQISLRPTFELGDYMALVPEVSAPEVSSDEVESRISEMLEQSANFVEVEKEVENGDNLVFDFEGFVDGEPFEGGKAESYSLKIGSGNFIAGFEEQLIGLKKDDEKDVIVTFPSDYRAENLAGKEATFKCKIIKVEQKEEVELTEEKAQELDRAELEPKDGETSIDTFKRGIIQQIQDEKLSKIYNEDTKPKLREILADNYSFDLPQSVINQELDQRLNSEVGQMTEEQLTALKSDQAQLEELKNKVMPEAEKSVRATFVIDALGTIEGISVSDQELQQIIGYEAMMSGQDPVDTLKKYEESGYLPLIKMSILEDKVLTKLLEKKMSK